MVEKDIVVARLVAHAILLGQNLRSTLSKRLCQAIDNPCSGRTREVCHVSPFLLKEFRHNYYGERSKSGTKKGTS